MLPAVIANGEDPKRSSSVKRLQSALLKKEKRIKAKLDKVKDTGLGLRPPVSTSCTAMSCTS